MIVGFEWLIDALDCDENALRDVDLLRGVFMQIVADLELKTIGGGNWHKFEGEGGVTGLVMLTESHLACHTYPEHKSATFNLYCCRNRPEWNWAERLTQILGAKTVTVERIERGDGQTQASILRGEIEDLKSKIEHSQAEIADAKSQIEEARWEMLDFRAKMRSANAKNAGGEH